MSWVNGQQPLNVFACARHAPIQHAVPCVADCQSLMIAAIAAGTVKTVLHRMILPDTQLTIAAAVLVPPSAAGQGSLSCSRITPPAEDQHTACQIATVTRSFAHMQLALAMASLQSCSNSG